MPLPPLQGEQQANTSVCPRCGAGLRCGMIAGDAQCWCAQLPNIMPVPPVPSALPAKAALAPDANRDAASSPLAGLATPDENPLAASCLCPACLKQITNERLHAS